MNAGPGSTEVGETGLFATNRNFPGRTGKGETYLCSPAVAAASAVEGYICGPDRLPPLPEYNTLKELIFNGIRFHGDLKMPILEQFL